MADTTDGGVATIATAEETIFEECQEGGSSKREDYTSSEEDEKYKKCVVDYWDAATSLISLNWWSHDFKLSDYQIYRRKSLRAGRHHTGLIL